MYGGINRNKRGDNIKERKERVGIRVGRWDGMAEEEEKRLWVEMEGEWGFCWNFITIYGC